MNSDEERLVDVVAQSQVALDPAESITPATAGSTNAVESLETNAKPRWFILEPAVLLFFFAVNLSSAVYQNQILYQTCRVIFNYNDTDCDPLLGVQPETAESEAIETIVQPYVTKILMSRSLLESIIPAFVSLFIGPWSDKFGRRPILLLTFTGYFFAFVILTILTLVSQHVDLSPWYYTLASMPSVFFGGTCALITGIYCYISDVAVSRSRAFRMVLNEASILTGLTTGSVASSYVYEATNVLTVFLLSTGFMFLSITYVFFFIPESLPADQICTGSRIREFFRWDLAKNLFKTCFERRPKYDRAIIWLVMLTLTITILVMEGDNTVTYLFVRKRFEWNLENYSLFNAARIVIQIVGSVLGMVVLRKYLGVSIISMALIAYGCSVLESTVRATAIYSWHMYLGTVLGSIRGVSGPMCRAILSHVTPASDLGKVFALTTSLESLSPLASAPLYTTVYSATITSNPGAFNYISTMMFFICYTFLAIVYGIQKSFGNTSYQEIGS